MIEEKNPFKKLEEVHAAPEALKERVMTSVELSQLLLEVTDLFTDKMGKVALNLFKTDIKGLDTNTPNDDPIKP